MKAAYRILAIFVLYLATISQHTTASAVEMFKFKGLGANASFSSVDPSGCILTNVYVFTAEAMIKVHPGRQGPFSSVNIFLSQHDLCTDTPLLAAEGVADLAEPDLQISSKTSFSDTEHDGHRPGFLYWQFFRCSHRPDLDGDCSGHPRTQQLSLWGSDLQISQPVQRYLPCLGNFRQRIRWDGEFHARTINWCPAHIIQQSRHGNRLHNVDRG